MPPVLLVLSEQTLDAPSLNLQFGVVQGMTDGLIVRLTKPGFASLILTLADNEVVLEFGRGSHSAVLLAWPGFRCEADGISLQIS
jgi:hypothetical protein